MMNRSAGAFGAQRAARGLWRRYIDQLEGYRPALHAYCRRLTGNVWGGEGLVQDTLLRVFGLLGKTDTTLHNPQAYLIRTATNLWIDQVRRRARERAVVALEQAEASSTPFREPADARSAARALFQMLHPQERAAILMKDVFDLPLEETAALLCTTVGAVKSALSRARGRLEGERPAAGLDAPPRELIERFMSALAAKDMQAMKTLCATHISVELVGGVELASFEKAQSVFKHAHMVMTSLGFGERPWWRLAEYEGETIVLGFRTLDGVEDSTRSIESMRWTIRSSACEPIVSVQRHLLS